MTDPMTDEEMERFALVVTYAIPWVSTSSERNALTAEYVTAARRLLPEVQRLRGRTEALAKEAQFQGRRADQARSECAALTAKVAEAWAEGYALGVNDERTSAANVGIAGFGMKVNPARNNPYRAPGMPHAPAQGAPDGLAADQRGTGERNPHARPEATEEGL